MQASHFLGISHAKAIRKNRGWRDQERNAAAIQREVLLAEQVLLIHIAPHTPDLALCMAVIVLRTPDIVLYTQEIPSCARASTECAREKLLYKPH